MVAEAGSSGNISLAKVTATAMHNFQGQGNAILWCTKKPGIFMNSGSNINCRIWPINMVKYSISFQSWTIHHYVHKSCTYPVPKLYIIYTKGVEKIVTFKHRQEQIGLRARCVASKPNIELRMQTLTDGRMYDIKHLRNDYSLQVMSIG